MCGGFFGSEFHKLGKALGVAGDPLGKKIGGSIDKNNIVERKKRLANEEIAAADARSASDRAADLAEQTSNNQALQAEAVAMRRRKAAQSLLAAAGPNAAVDEQMAGQSNLSRGRAYGIRSSLG